ncbi:general odorant-binding protein 99a-like [Bactrocera neohumeralis]|uniref:general odorant-binding protein 99a-like n=1 Tax=Bactrocera tryoni TaxID=59916 RepID=UPI001A95C4DE|nr:general odorant-binding protein 99a-like [Bactrocera tryoni]XP_050326292.1 general odorant-binding protein 99a-like [Bactrocera neohumeralis]
MKFFIVILAVIALAYAKDEWVPKTEAELAVIVKECLKDFPLSNEQLQKYATYQYPDEEPIRKYMLCTAKRVGFFSEHEGYHADRVAKQFKIDLDEAEIVAIAEGCADKNVEGSSVDVWAYRGYKCVIASKIGERLKAYIQNLKEEAKKH